LCENKPIAYQEVFEDAQHPSTGAIVSFPNVRHVIWEASVSLRYVADLTDVSQQQLLATNAQELTGDWRGYAMRRPGCPVSEPRGMAPTQELGLALSAVRGLEAFLAISAKYAIYRNLVVSPNKLAAGSRIQFINHATGQAETMRG
jgi:hypothetical protein